MRNTYINLKLRAIRVFYGGIIALDPLVVDELGCSRMSFVLQRGRQGSVVAQQHEEHGTRGRPKAKAKATATAKGE